MTGSLTRCGSISMGTSLSRLLYGQWKTHMSCMTCPCSHRNLVSGLPCHVVTSLSMNSDQYIMMLREFVNMLLAEKKQITQFQQDNATAHTATNITAYLEECFAGRLIS